MELTKPLEKLPFLKSSNLIYLPISVISASPWLELLEQVLLTAEASVDQNRPQFGYTKNYSLSAELG